MAYALKTELEQFIATQIFAIAGLGSPTVDSDLSAAQKLNFSQWGYGVLPQDRPKGPLVRTAINSYNETQITGGQGTQHRSVQATANMTIEGITQQYANPQSAAIDRDVLEAVIRLNLWKIPGLNVTSTFTSQDKFEGLAILDWGGTSFTFVDNTNYQGGPIIGEPVADPGNTSTGTFSSDTSQAYTAASDLVYTVEVVTGNTVPGSLTGLTFRWKAGSGSFSSPIAATGSYQALSNGVKVSFTVATGQSFVATDSWSISAFVKGMSYVGYFIQQWKTTIELIAGT